jgi:DNA-binding MarR family transcriptional regulator
MDRPRSDRRLSDRADIEAVRSDRRLEEEFDEVDSLVSDCVINLFQTQALVEDQLGRHLRPHGLSLGGFRLAMILRIAGEPLTPMEIAKRLRVTRGSVTGLLDSLEGRGVVERRPHPADRRMLLVDLTGDGRRRLDDLLPGWFLGERDIFGVLAPDEQETLLDLLGRIQRPLLDRRYRA